MFSQQQYNMTPEEKQLLIDTHNKLEEFLNIYYKTNFPALMKINKAVEVNSLKVLGGLEIKDLAVKGKLGLFGDAPVNQASAVVNANITAGAHEDNEARGKINEILNVLRYYNLLP